MAFAFGLGSGTMLGQYQKDSTEFKLVDMASNIQKFNSAPAPPAGQAPISSAIYVDYTFHHLNRFMEQDQLNDNNTTFLYEYQALLRSRIQQMITDLTAALTRDLDLAMSTQRFDWDDRMSAQGFTSDIEDAGAARMAYNFFTGFAGLAVPDRGTITSIAYVGIPTFDSAATTLTGNTNKVSPDTSSDAAFGTVAPTADNQATTYTNTGTDFPPVTARVAGTALLQQFFPEDGLVESVIDNLVIRHNNANVLYRDEGGGFIAHKNAYKFIDPADTGGAGSTRYSANNIQFLNGSISHNLNDQAWDTATAGFDAFVNQDNAKNEFQKILYQTIFELDQRNLLRDIMRLSENNGFLNDIEIASTSSITTGSQIQAKIRLNFVPLLDGAVDTTDVDGDSDTAEIRAYRPDLGGKIQIIMDRFSCFYHS